MYWRFILQAMRLRARRLSLAFAALGVAAALATALFSIYSDVETRIGAEFVSYGANLTVVSRGISPSVPLTAMAVARQAGATAAAPFLFTTGKIVGQPVALVGVDQETARDLTRFWHIEGSRGPCLAGVNLAHRFLLQIGSEAPLASAPCRIDGIVSTGGPEDNEFILPFATIARIASVRNAASVVEVRAPADALQAVETTLRRAIPNADVRVINAIAATETNVIAKVRVTLFLLLAVILVITTISVTSNFSELVMERRGEIGILKAIGAAERKIASLFLTESVLLALGSAVTGYLVGVLLAAWIGQSVFNSPFLVQIKLSVLLLSATLTLLVALVATALAAGNIWRIQPARILRGE